MDRQVGSTIAGKYRLIGIIGRGGMGVVYGAEHVMTRRRVAVKVLHAHHRGSDAATRFINEAQSAGKLSHPNIVEVLDAGEDSDGSLYLVLELLSGHDLASALVQKRQLEVAETVTVIAQVLQALVIAHRHQIIHRDIKPENIYLTKSVTGDLHVKILDFGISKAIGPGEYEASLGVTQTNTTVGTPHYMSPEQARGERTIDTRADLWAAGVVLYECLSGKVPFDGDTYNDQIVRVITEPHVPLSNYDVPLDLSRVVDKALQKDRTRRYALAEEMLADVRQFIERHPQYASVPAHILREPVATDVPSASGPLVVPVAVPSVRPPSPSVRPPPVGAIPPTPAPSAGGTPLDFSEDMPTTVRFSPDESVRLRAPIVVPQGPLPAPTHSVPPPRQPAAVAPPSAPTVRMEPAIAGLSRRTLVIAGLASAAVIATVGAIALRHGPPPPPVVNVIPPRTVSVRFVGMPPGARLTAGGAVIPAAEHITLPQSSQPIIIEITAPGFHPAHFELVPDSDQTVPLMLQPQEPTPAPSATPDMEFLPDPDAATTPAAATAPTAPSSPSTAPEPSPPPTPTPSATPVPSPSADLAPPSGRGGIIVRANPPCTIAIDGQIRGTTPIARVSLPAGPHRVICRLDTGALRTRNVAVTPGSDVVVDFSSSTLPTISPQ